MLCLCSQKLNNLAQALASLQLGFGAKLSATLPGILIAAKIDLKAALAAAAAFSVQLPGLNLGALQAAAAAAGAVMSIRTGLGINLLDLKMAAELKSLAESVAAHAGLLAGLPLPRLALMMDLQAVLSAILQAKAELGINLLGPTASAELAAAASGALAVNAALGGAAGSLSAMIALALALKGLQMSLGLQLGSPGAAAQLSAALALMASLKLPSISLNLPKIGLLIMAAQLAASAKLALGIDLTAAGAGAALALALKALLSLSLPKLALGAALNFSGLKAALGLQAGLALPALTIGVMPDFTGLSALASLAASVKLGFGIDLLAKIPCGALCPVG
jgi:hypothetical protein